jgi:hypothetical protein
MFRFKYRIYIILFLFIPVFSTGASGNNKAVDVSSVIHAEDNLLTVKVRDIPLRKVLMEIANQTSIKIVLYASAEEPFITNFSRLPMEKGLKKLLRDYSYTFTYGGEYSKGEEREIRKVVILSNGGGSRHRRAEPMITYREETHLYDEPYGEDVDIQEEHMPDPLKELETITASTGGSYHEPMSIDRYDEDVDIPDEDMHDPLEEPEPMIVTTGGAALGPLGEVPYDEDLDIRDEEMENEIIIGHLKDELGDEDAGVRLSAVEILGVIGGDKAIQALEGALTDEDEKVREMAAEELSRLKGEG